MKDQTISFETTKLAKEKGYDMLLWNGEKETLIYKPTQSLLQKWLREIHELDVNAISYAISPKKYFVSIYMYIDLNFMGELYNTTDRYDKNGSKKKQLFFNSYEEALENGLLEALKRL